jgi:regulatory protein
LDSVILKKIANYCVYQERTHLEVQKKLADLKVFGDEADEFKAWLVTENYLNEERFAKIYASSKFRLKKWGRRKIEFELKNKGLSKNCIKIGMAEIKDKAYDEMISELIEKKKTELFKHENPLIIKQKVLHYLMNKGYTSTEILDLYSE